MKLCEYGCGREAKFSPCKGKLKWSCEESCSKCPAIKKKYGSSGKKNGMYGKKHSKKTKKLIAEKATGRSCKRENYIPYNKGKTLIELHGEKIAKEIKEKRSKSVCEKIVKGECKPFYKYKFLHGYFYSLKNEDFIYNSSAFELAMCHFL